MTPIDTAELERLAADMTPGPWAVDSEYQGAAWGIEYSVHVAGNILDEIADSVSSEANARAIALVPALIREVLAYRKAEAGMRALRRAGCGLAFSEPADTRTEYRSSDLCASGQVRALVWDEYAPGCFFGKSECGDYSVAPSASAFHEDEIRLSDVEGNFSYFASPEAAKAAAQADYERRILSALTPAPQPEGEAVLVSQDALIDLIGEFGREVCYMLDDCETSGPVGEEVHTITDESLTKVSAILDRIDALPFEEPGVILGTGAMLQAAIKQTFQIHPPQPSETVAEAGLTVEQVQMAWTAERDRLTAESDRLEMQCFAQGKLISELQIELAALRALKGESDG